MIGRVFHAIATFKRDSPFVQVYAANEDTIVHIRQLIYTTDDESIPKESHDGLVMTLMQFRSLMFHLRALDAQFMQSSGVQLHNLCEKKSQIDTVTVGKKRTWTEMDDSNVSIDKKVRHEQTDTIAWEELDNILATISPADDVKLESKSIHAQDSVHSNTNIKSESCA